MNVPDPAPGVPSIEGPRPNEGPLISTVTISDRAKPAIPFTDGSWL